MSLLDGKIYKIPLAASILNVDKRTLMRWLKEVIRVDNFDDDSVTWGEFVEAKYFCEYRKTHKIPFRELKTFIDILRVKTETLYPLTGLNPWVEVN